MKAEHLFYSVDEYGVRNFHTSPILIATFLVFFGIIWFAAHGVLHFESFSTTANVTNFQDAFWLCFMSASTIGFGDFYPTTIGGRLIIGSMFVLGGVILGIIIGLVSSKIMSFTDTSVKNRELRKQNAAILVEMKEAKESYQKQDLDNGEEIKKMLEELLRK